MKFRFLKLFGKSKEAETIELFNKMMQEILSANYSLFDAGSALLKNDYKTIEEKAKDVSKHEHTADELVKEILNYLYSGAFLPSMRKELSELLITLDDVIDNMQNAANVLGYLRGKQFPQKIRDIYKKMFEENKKAVMLLKEVMNDFFENKPALLDHIKEAKLQEHKLDVLKKEVFDNVLFDKKLNPISSRLLGDIANFVSSISDSVERVTEKVMVLKFLRQS